MIVVGNTSPLTNLAQCIENPLAGRSHFTLVLPSQRWYNFLAEWFRSADCHFDTKSHRSGSAFEVRQLQRITCAYQVVCNGRTAARAFGVRQRQGFNDLMASERAFLRQRLALVERWLADSDREFIPADKRRVRRRTRPASRQDLTYKREARLLRKLLARSREGQVLTTLKAWRCQLREFLREHRQRYKEMQDAYDAWWRLPRDERGTTPKPPKPPSARYVDCDGAPWIIDDRFLASLDDLIVRLQKWLREA